MFELSAKILEVTIDQEEAENEDNEKVKKLYNEWTFLNDQKASINLKRKAKIQEKEIVVGPCERKLDESLLKLKMSQDKKNSW